MSSSSSSAFPTPQPGLKRWRRHHELTQAQLAKALGVHQSTISEWEHGRGAPRLDQARRLRELLKAPSIEALFPENGAAA